MLAVTVRRPRAKPVGASRPPFCWPNLLLRLSLRKSEVLRLLSNVVVQVTKKLGEHARPHDDPAARWTPSASPGGLNGYASLQLHARRCDGLRYSTASRQPEAETRLRIVRGTSASAVRFPAREFQRVVMLMWIIKIEASKARDVLVQFLLEKEAVALDISFEFSSVPGRRQTATLGSSEPENARVNEFSNCVRMSGWPTLAPRVVTLSRL